VQPLYKLVYRFAQLQALDEDPDVLGDDFLSGYLCNLDQLAGAELDEVSASCLFNCNNESQYSLVMRRSQFQADRSSEGLVQELAGPVINNLAGLGPSDLQYQPARLQQQASFEARCRMQSQQDGFQPTPAASSGVQTPWCLGAIAQLALQNRSRCRF
jgi:hypothetical protein